MKTKLKQTQVNEIKIEKGIPIPPMRNSPNKYPVESLNVGDSFLSPPGARPMSFRTAVANKAKKLGFKITTRQTPQGLRVWRIE